MDLVIGNFVELDEQEIMLVEGGKINWKKLGAGIACVVVGCIILILM